MKTLLKNCFKAGTWHYCEVCPSCLAYGCGISYGVCRKIGTPVFTSNYYILVTSRIAPTQTLCSVHSTISCDVRGVNLELIRGRSGDLLRFIMKYKMLCFMMVLLWHQRWPKQMASSSLEWCLANSCNQPVCGLNTLDLQVDILSHEQFPMTVGTLSWLSNTPWLEICMSF